MHVLKGKYKVDFLWNVLLIGIVSLILQFSWEYGQCAIFYDMNDDLDFTSLLMWSAIWGDIMMTLILYVLISLLNQDVNWFLKPFQRKDFVIMVLYALFLSFYFEISAHYTSRWTYSSSMPLVYKTNIGVIPVLQLLLLFPLSFKISMYLRRI
ncbi:hypothetical protein [Bacillus sp. 2205SS5-2]|uniref:hypothetical protein n=1 Tax=Bacillus sp. 2205SS5-2 TaxID=3109031 RepID=UPI003006AF79